MVALGCLVLFAACGGKEDPTEAVRDFLSRGSRMAEEHDVKALMELTTEGFSLEPQGMDRHEVRKALLFVFRHYGSFRILYPKPRIQFKEREKRARVALPFVIVRKEVSIPGLKQLLDDPREWVEEVGDRADLYWLELELFRGSGESWKAEVARIRPLGPGMR